MPTPSSPPPSVEVIHMELPWRVVLLMRYLRLRLWLAAVWVTRDRHPRRWRRHFRVLRDFERGFAAEVERAMLLGPEA